jgi:ankyrin repeat protein
MEEELTLLHHAVYDENLEVVRLIKDNLSCFRECVDENSNEEGWTPLLLAAQQGNMTIVKMLIDSGAHPMMQNNNRTNIFHLAASNGDVRMLDLAMKQDRHYTVDTEAEDGWTPA